MIIIYHTSAGMLKVKKNVRDQPHGRVKFVRSVWVAQGFMVQILGADMALLIRLCWDSIPHGTTRETYSQNIQLCTGGLWGKELGGRGEEDWQQILAQVPIFKKKVWLQLINAFKLLFLFNLDICNQIIVSEERKWTIIQSPDGIQWQI